MLKSKYILPFACERPLQERFADPWGIARATMDCSYCIFFIEMVTPPWGLAVWLVVMRIRDGVEEALNFEVPMICRRGSFMPS